MSIRQTLLITFLLFSIIAAALMTALAYSNSRAALSGEINLNLETQAVTSMRQIEALLFERIENLHGWSELELMQEIRVGDVDKRLANFLKDIKFAYAGIYTNLFCVINGTIVSASDASLIGNNWDPIAPWLQVSIHGSKIILHRPEMTDEQNVLTMHTALINIFNGTPMGEIYARFNWDEIYKLLDQVIGQTQRFALLLDAEGKILATSSNIFSNQAIKNFTFTDWYEGDVSHGVSLHDGQRFGFDKVLVGYTDSKEYKWLSGFGWRLMIITPEQVAFAPVQQLLWTLLGLLMAIVILAIMLAIRISGHIAKPIQALTSFTYNVGAEMEIPPDVLPGNSEVAKLSQAFNRMFIDLKKSRETLVRASKLVAVGEMAAMLAHEVRTPLGILRSSAQLLQRQTGLDERGYEMLDYMLSECDRINELVKRLLESAKPREPLYAENDANEIIHHVIEMVQSFADDKQIHIEVELMEQPVILECDRDQLIQAILNLALNAIQILPSSGNIRIRLSAGKSAVTIEVADDGPGIPMEERDNILDPFVSHRQGGVGLGLAIVYGIIQIHQGEMVIDDSDMGGASFKITLPFKRLENEG